MFPDISMLSISMPPDISVHGDDSFPTVFVTPLPETPDTTLPVVHAIPLPPNSPEDSLEDEPDTQPPMKKTKPNALPVARMDGILTLKPHQYGPALAVAAHFEKPKAVAAGVLVFYEVGTGKTFAALHAGRTFLDITKDKGVMGHVYIITTKANIEATWKRDWDVYKSGLNETTPGASAPYTKAIDWGTKDIMFKTTFKSPYMLIIDEAHLLRNLDSVSAPQVLDICANAAYVMPLTATPIVRTVNNLDALYSYMMGEDERIIHLPTVAQAEDGDHTTTPMEAGKYFNNMVIYQAQDTARYPSVIESTSEVPLGNDYEVFIRLDLDKLKELHDKIKSKRLGKERWDTTIARLGALGPEGSIPNPFHVNGRQVCNSVDKFKGIWDAIVDDGDSRVVVFSNFRNEGIDGFMEWLLKTKTFHRTGKRDYEYIVRKDVDGPTYEVVLWNNDHFDAITKWQHKVDDITKILLISPMAREGLSLKGVRQFHLMEPSWNVSDETQAIGRAVRMTSHAHLPPSEQNVNVCRWIATYEGGETADERIRDLADMRARVITPYLQRLRWLGSNYLDRLLNRLDL